MRPYTLHTGKSEIVLKDYPDNFFDSCVTDSPYGIRFMGKAWDHFDIEKKSGYRKTMKSRDVNSGRNGAHMSTAIEAGKYDLSPKAMVQFQKWFAGISSEIYRVLKPGAYFLNFAAPRTYHRMACGVEEAGFEIRDQMMWVFSSGFPKSYNLEGEHEGWGTALKPAHEPIVVARKPYRGTIIKNMDTHGVGAFNIEACRVEGEPWFYGNQPKLNGGRYQPGQITPKERHSENIVGGENGRWPANFMHDGGEGVLKHFPNSKGQQGDIKGTEKSHTGDENANCYGEYKRVPFQKRIESDGSAARFFYCAKVSQTDRNDGLINDHATVKPTDLCRYLQRLVTPKGGITLDPFRGSGSFGKSAMYEFLHYVGIDEDPRWELISQHRIEYAIKTRDRQISIFP
jgi:site-specific DNA-methyltransferase (adenine-specific)